MGFFSFDDTRRWMHRARIGRTQPPGKPQDPNDQPTEGAVTRKPRPLDLRPDDQPADRVVTRLFAEITKQARKPAYEQTELGRQFERRAWQNLMHYLSMTD